MKKDEKTNSYHIPTLYDVKGSGDFYDQSHCGITVYRVYDDDGGYTKVIPTKVKFKFQGEQGAEVLFKFNKKNGRFYEFNDDPDDNDFTKKVEKEQNYSGFKNIDTSSNEFLDEELDIPF